MPCWGESTLWRMRVLKLQNLSPEQLLEEVAGIRYCMLARFRRVHKMRAQNERQLQDFKATHDMQLKQNKREFQRRVDNILLQSEAWMLEQKPYAELFGELVKLYNEASSREAKQICAAAKAKMDQEAAQNQAFEQLHREQRQQDENVGELLELVDNYVNLANELCNTLESVDSVNSKLMLEFNHKPSGN